MKVTFFFDNKYVEIVYSCQCWKATVMYMDITERYTGSYASAEYMKGIKNPAVIVLKLKLKSEMVIMIK